MIQPDKQIPVMVGFFRRWEDKSVVLNSACKCHLRPTCKTSRWEKRTWEKKGENTDERRGADQSRGSWVWSQRGKLPQCMGLAFNLFVLIAVFQTFILSLWWALKLLSKDRNYFCVSLWYLIQFYECLHLLTEWEKVRQVFRNFWKYAIIQKFSQGKHAVSIYQTKTSLLCSKESF